MTKKTDTETAKTFSGGNSPVPKRPVTTLEESGGNSPTPPRPPVRPTPED